MVRIENTLSSYFHGICSLAYNEQGLALAAINLGKLTAQAYYIPLAVKGRASTQAACAKQLCKSGNLRVLKNIENENSNYRYT